MNELPMLGIVLCCYREGVLETVYKDSLGKTTAGIGHLLTEEEQERYKVGQKISLEQVSEWYQKDFLHAYGAARAQAKEIGVEAMHFVAALTSVNFQLGTNWYKIHKKTWQHLLDHNWEDAAKEAQNSRWYKQTPVRVKDFQEAILRNSHHAL